MILNTRKSPYAKVSSIPQEDMNWSEGFWNDRFNTCAEVTVPHIRKLFEDDSPIFHNVENFRIAAGLKKGEHKGTPFADGDFYKWMEAAMYVAAKKNDKALEKDLDSYIDLIGRAQQEDGYISTKQIIAEKYSSMNIRNSDINDFEVYNFGHLFTAACVYKRITGKDNFLNIACKAAEYLKKMYNQAAVSGDVKTAVCPSHYMGLVELYRTTGEKSYLDLALLSLQLRDKVEDGTDDNQDRIPLLEQRTIVGHAVRSTYLYSGVADIYAENGDERYKEVLDACLDNCINKKLYITGGCGALYQGVSPVGDFWKGGKVHQAFGYEYQLPNVTAYNETCAALGNIFWNYRMFAINPQAEYFDVIERTFLNIALASVSLDGDKYFYENMLRRTKGLDYELIWPLERKSILECFCCPPNIARVLAQASEYAYMVSEDSVYTGIYGSSEAAFNLDCGSEFTLKQETEYPWDGVINFSFNNIKNAQPFTFNIRIPEWVSNGSISINGEKIKELTSADASSYYSIKVEDLQETKITVDFAMEARLTVSHSKVEENINQVAVERGPLVYCIESADTDVETIDDLLIPVNAEFKEAVSEVKGVEVVELQTEGVVLKRDNFNREELYQTFEMKGIEKKTVKLIPYFCWDNRGFGEMKIWLPVYFQI